MKSEIDNFKSEMTSEIPTVASPKRGSQASDFFRISAFGFRTWPAAVLVACSLVAFAQETNAPSGLNYSAFQVISERNIFNPHRYARTLRTAGPSRRAVRVDVFALVGMISYE